MSTGTLEMKSLCLVLQEVKLHFKSLHILHDVAQSEMLFEVFMHVFARREVMFECMVLLEVN